jgi:YVTN family beta-propeller protein
MQIRDATMLLRLPLVHVAMLFALLPSAAAWAQEKPASEKPQYPGATDDGFLLPNGWTISPAGEQIPTTDLPLNILSTPDGRYALVATSGYNRHELTLFDLQTRQQVASESVHQSWFGLAADWESKRIWWSGGGGGGLHSFDGNNHQLLRTSAADSPGAKAQAKDKAKTPTPAASKTDDDLSEARFRTGVAWDGRRNLLYSLHVPVQGSNRSLAWDSDSPLNPHLGAITASDPSGKQPARTAPAGTRPYDVLVGRNGQIFVSDWAQAHVLVLEANTLRTIDKIRVGEHPTQLALHPRDDRLFVACASSNSVSVIDSRRGIVTETIITSLFPLAPEGSTPDALVVAPDGRTLYVANADNNCVAVIDISQPSRSQVKGFIPTGWYPTAVALTPDGKTLLVGVGKGNQTKPNPISAPKAAAKPAPSPAPGDAPEIAGPKTKSRKRAFPYIGTTLSGALSIVAVPNDEQLAAYTETVYRNCPYSDKLLSQAPHPRKTAIPTRVGDPSPIKHVIYIIKENRTFDQVFGDIGRGNCDPSLVMFGEQVTPNHHKLANEFVLLDNLYCNGHVSADGHPWSTMAYNTDYIARNWALTYSTRAGIDDDDDGDLTNAPSGYLWDACARNGLSYRNYGEYGGRVSQPDGSFRMEGRVPGLVGHMCPTYGLSKKRGQKVRDTDNVEVFLEEFRKFEADGNLPRLIIMSLGEDHTTGTTPDTFTPQSCVASNDLALGRLVEAVSHSKYWPEIAIFVIEDDAQNGPDHVDAHRTAGLVISPYVRRKHLDSTQYSTVSMLRTMELILGLAPLSQFDAAANPMFGCFTDACDATPYELEKARIDLNAKNTPLAYGAERSSKMDFSEYDKIDDFELNEVLWRAVKGKDAPLPPAVRRAIAFRLTPR